MAAVIYTAPATEPLTAAEAKTHLRLETTADDADVTALIVAARKFVEHGTGRSLVTQTWDLYLDEFPECEPIRLGRGPVQAITSIRYYATDGTLTTLDSAYYLLDSTQDPARLALATDYTWPDTQDRINAVIVRYTAGFGAASAVPEDLKHAMKLLIGHWYENREGLVVGTISKALEFAVDALLDGHRILSPLAA